MSKPRVSSVMCSWVCAAELRTYANYLEPTCCVPPSPKFWVVAAWSSHSAPSLAPAITTTTPSRNLPLSLPLKPTNPSLSHVSEIHSPFGVNILMRTSVQSRFPPTPPDPVKNKRANQMFEFSFLGESTDLDNCNTDWKQFRDAMRGLMKAFAFDVPKFGASESGFHFETNGG